MEWYRVKREAKKARDIETKRMQISTSSMVGRISKTTKLDKNRRDQVLIDARKQRIEDMRLAKMLEKERKEKEMAELREAYAKKMNMKKGKKKSPTKKKSELRAKRKYHPKVQSSNLSTTAASTNATGRIIATTTTVSETARVVTAAATTNVSEEKTEVGSLATADIVITTSVTISSNET